MGSAGGEVLTSEGRRGGSDPLVLTQLWQQVSDTIGDAGLGTRLGRGTVVVALPVQEELAGEDGLHVGHDESLLGLVWGPWVLLAKAQTDLVLRFLVAILQVGAQFYRDQDWRLGNPT